MRQASFEGLYNSTNIEDIAGRSYDVIVCSGAPAEKWKANKEPDRDREVLGRLTDALVRAEARKVVLISTVDVYPVPSGVDEATVIDEEQAQPYGKHRRELERAIAARFDTLIVRLPGLFGTGLKKNIIFDFLHGNRVDQVHADSVFQFYHLDMLWRDIGIARDRGLDLVNFATEPVSVREVARRAFGLDFDNAPPSAPARYDVRSHHASTWGGHRGYLRDREEVLTALRGFVGSERERSPA